MLVDNPCPLCQHPTQWQATDQRPHVAPREYWHCPQCELVHVPARFHLTAAAEKALYDVHENDPSDVGYRNFLAQLISPLRQHLSADAEGLDFGCGPGPALVQMCNEQGFPCTGFDIYYANQPELLQQTYDFITSTEVFEHLRQPAEVIEQLLTCLRPRGLLGIMTKPWTAATDFARWHYANDPTHISFYQQQTFAFIAKRYSLKIVYQQANVCIWQRD